MLSSERQRMITDIINTRGSVTVAELAAEVDASEATIRRDLCVLDKARLIVKVFGGATAVGLINTREEAVRDKKSRNVEEKDKIAHYAAGLIKKGDFIYIDSGTTTLKLIDYISEDCGASFVTNGIAHAAKLIEKKLRVFMTGGWVKPQTEAIVGAECVTSLEKYHFSAAFMGTNGISMIGGCTTPDIDEAMVKRAAVAQARITYILADETKFDETSAVTFAGLSQCTILTDHCDIEEYRQKARIIEV